MNVLRKIIRALLWPIILLRIRRREVAAMELRKTKAFEDNHCQQCLLQKRSLVLRETIESMLGRVSGNEVVLDN